VFAALAVPSFAADAPPSAAPDWAIGDLYATPDAWTASCDKVKAQLASLDKYKGTLGRSAASMLEAFSALSAINKEAQRLSVYASLIGDEDVRDSHNRERVQLAGDLQTRIGESTAWMTPEILAVGEKRMLAFEAQSPELKARFGFILDNTLRGAPHTLGVESEGIMASAGNVLGQPHASHDRKPAVRERELLDLHRRNRIDLEPDAAQRLHGRARQERSGKARLPGQGAGADPLHLLPPDDVRRIPARGA
jgi:oligoendopeptidase F